MGQTVKQRFQYLFEDARRRNESYREAQCEDCTFAPEVNKQRKSDDSFTERNARSLLKKRLHSRTEKSFSFVPSIGRAPLRPRKKPEEDVGHYLHRTAANKRTSNAEQSASLRGIEKFLGEGIRELLSTVRIKGECKSYPLDEFFNDFKKSYKKLIQTQKSEYLKRRSPRNNTFHVFLMSYQ